MYRASYRSRQFFAALFGRVQPDEMSSARRVLGPNLYPLFARMPSQYRRHALTVYRRVIDAGCTDPHVLRAALLHDVGKYSPSTGRYVTLGHRVAIVLLKATPPGKRLLKALARPNPQGISGILIYPFYLSSHHAELGSQLAASHGAAPEVVQLIARHHCHDLNLSGLSTLQAADDQS